MIDLVIVSDRADSKLTRQTVHSFKYTISCEYQVFIEPFNGYNKSLNNGIKKGWNEWIACCNNDLIFEEGWFDHFLTHCTQFDSLSGWCPLTHHQWWGNKTPKGIVIGNTTGKILTGWCILIKRKAWEKIGGFDERLSFWACDNATSEQYKHKRINHALVPQMRIKHLQSQTLNTKSKNEYQKLTMDQLKLFNKLYKKELRIK